MFELVEKTFDQMPLSIQMAVVFSWCFAVLTRWDHRRRPLRGNAGQKCVRIIAAIGNHLFKIERGNSAQPLG